MTQEEWNAYMQSLLGGAGAGAPRPMMAGKGTGTGTGTGTGGGTGPGGRVTQPFNPYRGYGGPPSGGGTNIGHDAGKTGVPYPGGSLWTSTGTGGQRTGWTIPGWTGR